MLSTLSFLIHGEQNVQQCQTISDLECLYLINKNQPLRDSNGNPVGLTILQKKHLGAQFKISVDSSRIDG